MQLSNHIGCVTRKRYSYRMISVVGLGTDTVIEWCRLWDSEEIQLWNDNGRGTRNRYSYRIISVVGLGRDTVIE